MATITFNENIGSSALPNDLKAVLLGQSDSLPDEIIRRATNLAAVEPGCDEEWFELETTELRQMIADHLASN